MRQFNSNVKVNVIDNRKNGGNYKWQIEKLDVILDFFNDDFFNDYPNVKVNVIVNSKEVFPKMIVDGVSIFPDYIRYFKAFSKSKKEMVEEMNYMVEMMNNELNNNMEENNMSNEMVNNVDLFNVYVKDVLVNEYIDAVSSAEDFADAYGDDCVENQYICGAMNYEYDIRQIWADWCWENNVMNHSDAYKYYDDNRDMFICEDDLDDIVSGLDGTDDVGDGECLVWVRNPYYVEQEQVENDSPCLDDVDRVVKVIEGYVNNYEGMLMNYDGNSASICVPWDVFNEDDMNMLIEDADFEEYVVDVLMGRDIKDMLVYDDGVYVSVDAKKFDKVA